MAIQENWVNRWHCSLEHTFGGGETQENAEIPPSKWLKVGKNMQKWGINPKKGQNT